MMLPVYLGLLDGAEAALAASFRRIAEGHGDEPDVFHICHTLAKQCDAHRERFVSVIERYGRGEDDAPDRLHAEEITETRSGAVGLLRDLQDLYVLTKMVDATWVVVKQAALGLRDEELLAIVDECERQTNLQGEWIMTRVKQAAPQALLVAR